MKYYRKRPYPSNNENKHLENLVLSICYRPYAEPLSEKIFLPQVDYLFVIL